MLIKPSIKCSDRIEAKSGSGNSRLEISSPLLVGHRDPRRSIAHVAAIKRALADRASIRVDLNRAWSACASYLLAALLDAGVDLVQQPIAMTNAKGMARLCCESAILIMPDEAPHRSESAFEIARETAARV